MSTPTQFTYHADLGQLLREIPADSIVSRTVYNDEQVKITLFGFAPGQELTEHTAASPAILQIVEGEASLTLGEENFEARAGAWAHMPAQLPHSLLAKSRVVMILYLLKQPR